MKSRARLCLLGCGVVGGLFFSGTFPLIAQGIPEPPRVVYGQLRDNASNARITSGTLIWSWVPVGGGAPVVVTVPLTNLIDQFSYVVQIPCESALSGQTSTGNALILATPNVTYARTSVTWNGQPLSLKEAAAGSTTLSAATRGIVERVDLGLGEFLPDSDGDGLPDWWELLHFGHPTIANPGDDPDGDGLSNWGEFIAGTDPNDGTSSFEFVRVTEDGPGAVLVEWSSVPDRRYTLLRSPTLSTDPRDYEEVQHDIESQGEVTSYRDSVESGAYFYRVRVVE